MPQERGVAQRLFSETGEMFDEEQLLRRELIFGWTFHRPDDLKSWGVHGIDLSTFRPDKGLLFRRSSVEAWVERPWPSLAAVENSTVPGGVDLIEVTTLGPDRTPWILSWNDGDALHQPKGKLVAAQDPHLKPPVYRFDLSHHPQWRGAIRTVRLQPHPEEYQQTRLRAVRGYRLRWDEEALEAATQRSWKIELADETRTVRLAGPDDEIVEQLEVPAEARLNASFAARQRLGKAVDFTLMIRTAERQETLLTATVKPTGNAKGGAPRGATGKPDNADDDPLKAGRWHDVNFDLAAWAGQTVELVMKSEIVDGRKGDLAYWADVQLTAPLTQERRPNVVLVSIDTLRADHMSLYGYERPTTPLLDAWAKEHGTVFESTVASSAWTFPSHLSLFTGLDTLAHGQHNPRPIPEDFDLLAEQLQAVGYRTLAVTGGGYVDPHYGFASGFDRYYTYPGDRQGIGDLTPGLEQAAAWLDDEEEPFFLFIHSYEVHSPYRIREPFYTQLTGQAGDPEQANALVPKPTSQSDTPGAIVRKIYTWRQDDGALQPLEEHEHQVVADIYDSSLAYADHHIGGFLQRLSEGEDENLVVVTSDHGEGLGGPEDQGLAEHSYLLDFNLMIPLIVALPGERGAGGRVSSQVRLVDVAPTMLDALGLDAFASTTGTSLLPLVDNPNLSFSEPAWAATSAQGIALRKDNRFKYIFNNTIWRRKRAQEALFLLDRDPQELLNVANERSTDDLRQAAIERYQKEFTGLWVTFQNPSQETAQLLLDGPVWLTPQFVRTVDAPDQAINSPLAGKLQVTVKPQQKFSLVIEQVSPTTALAFRLRSAAGTCELPDLVDAEDDAGAENASNVVARFFDLACQPLAASAGSGDDPGAPQIGFFFSSKAASSGQDGEALPSALRDQLQALGYVD